MKKVCSALFLFGLLACQEAPETKNQPLPKSKRENIEEFEKIHGASKPNWRDYDLHFWVNDSTINAYQFLGVTVQKDSTIKYIILTTNDLCDLIFPGVAKVNFSKMVEKGLNERKFENGFNSIERRKDILVRIQINSDTTLAAIEFARTGYADECDPIPNLILKRDEP